MFKFPTLTKFIKAAFTLVPIAFSTVHFLFNCFKLVYLIVAKMLKGLQDIVLKSCLLTPKITLNEQYEFKSATLPVAVYNDSTSENSAQHTNFSI